MGKQYRTTLDLKEGEDLAIRALCIIFRGIYNKALDIQFENLSSAKHSELLDETSVLKEVNDYKGTEDWYPKKLDEGIVQEAIHKATLSFKRWWSEKMNSSSSSWTYPRHLSMTRAFHFYTSSQLNVSKGSFIYFPKVGRFKLSENHYIPEGYYKNCKVQFDGKKWRIVLEDLNDEVEEIEFLRESLEVSLNDEGEIIVGEISFRNIIEGDTYIDLGYKLENLREMFKEAPHQSNRRKKLANSIMYTKTKMKDIKATYFRNVSKKILASKPRNLIISADQYSEHVKGFDSTYLNTSSTKFFVKMLKKKAERMGIKVTFKGIDSSIFVNEN